MRSEPAYEIKVEDDNILVKKRAIRMKVDEGRRREFLQADVEV